MMKGWVTWLAIIGTAALAAVDLINGDTAAAMEKFAIMIGLFGIGRKIEKTK